MFSYKMIKTWLFFQPPILHGYATKSQGPLQSIRLENFFFSTNPCFHMFSSISKVVCFDSWMVYHSKLPRLLGIMSKIGCFSPNMALPTKVRFSPSNPGRNFVQQFHAFYVCKQYQQGCVLMQGWSIKYQKLPRLLGVMSQKLAVWKASERMIPSFSPNIIPYIIYTLKVCPGRVFFSKSQGA